MKRLIAVLLVASLSTPVHAGLIGNASPGDRERIAAHLDREDVAAELASQGISKDQAKARVAALTDAEAASLAGQVDQLPAGGFVQVFALAAVAIPAAIFVAVSGLFAIVGGIAFVARAASKDSTSTAAASVNSRNAQLAAAERARAARPTVSASVAPPLPDSCRFNCQPATAERVPAARPTVTAHVAPPFPVSCRFGCQ